MSFIKDVFFGGAEKKAAEAEAAGISEGIAEQRRQFDITREDFSGFAERGGLAGEREAEFLGLRGVEAEQAAIAGFRESPGQVFLRERQERALLRNEAAIGGLGGGNVRTALQEQAFGIASTQLGERKSRLANVAQRGLGAVAGQAGIGAGISTNIAQLLAERGAVRGTGILGRASGIRRGLGQVAQAFQFAGGGGASPGGVTTTGAPI